MRRIFADQPRPVFGRAEASYNIQSTALQNKAHTARMIHNASIMIHHPHASRRGSRALRHLAQLRPPPAWHHRLRSVVNHGSKNVAQKTNLTLPGQSPSPLPPVNLISRAVIVSSQLWSQPTYRRSGIPRFIPHVRHAPSRPDAADCGCVAVLLVRARRLSPLINNDSAPRDIGWRSQWLMHKQNDSKLRPAHSDRPAACSRASLAIPMHAGPVTISAGPVITGASPASCPPLTGASPASVPRRTSPGLRVSHPVPGPDATCQRVK